jgi:hypothetical protein
MGSPPTPPPAAARWAEPPAPLSLHAHCAPSQRTSVVISAHSRTCAMCFAMPLSAVSAVLRVRAAVSVQRQADWAAALLRLRPAVSPAVQLSVQSRRSTGQKVYPSACRAVGRAVGMGVRRRPPVLSPLAPLLLGGRNSAGVDTRRFPVVRLVASSRSPRPLYSSFSFLPPSGSPAPRFLWLDSISCCPEASLPFELRLSRG